MNQLSFMTIKDRTSSFALALFTLALILPMSLLAQSELAIGEWASHLPYVVVHSVEQGDNKIFLSTDQSVMILDQQDETRKFLSKINGLSSADIIDIRYESGLDLLIVVYTNSTFDLVYADEIYTLTDIQDKADIQGDKTIYDMYVQNDKFLYLATGFGLVQYDLENLEFGFTLNLGTRVIAVDGEGSELLIATESGFFNVDLNVVQTPAFFQEWQELSQGLPDNYMPQEVFQLNGKIYVADENKIYVSTDKINFQLLLEGIPDRALVFLEETYDGYLIGERVGGTSPDSRLSFYNDSDELLSVEENCPRRLTDAAVDQQGGLYMGDQWQTINYKATAGGPCQKLEVDSPWDSAVTDMAIKDGNIYFSSGGVSDNLGDLFGRLGWYILKAENTWKNINGVSTPQLAQEELIQIHQVTASPRSEKVYFGSFWAGLLEYDPETEEIVVYDENTSPLETAVGDSRVRISGMDFDSDGNLWISNYNAAKPVSVLTPEGEWYSFSLGNGANNQVADLIVDENNYVWVTLAGPSGSVVVMDRGENLDDTSDDRQRIINQSNTEINSSFVYSIDLDQSGAVWVGTGAGAVVFDCGSSVFSEESCVGNRRRVEQDGEDAYLLETEEVLAIESDGADRKWFGTRNGLFVQGPNGEEKIALYDEGNSPLFSNTVNALLFNPDNGEMFIATDNGVQSIRTETSIGGSRHGTDVFAFPNPVRPEYRGPIAIKGLAQDAEVRITDIDGHLVYKTDALGGQAIWDGQNLEGNDVTGGVYLVFSSSSDFFNDIDTYVTKIMVVR